MNFQLPLAGSRDHFPILAIMAFIGWYIFQLPLAGSPKCVGNGSAGRAEAADKTFNSLSRDHERHLAPRVERGRGQNFQLPLAGSLRVISDLPGRKFASGLSTPSRGITPVQSEQKHSVRRETTAFQLPLAGSPIRIWKGDRTVAEEIKLSTPSRGITRLGKQKAIESRIFFQLPLAGSRELYFERIVV